MSKKLAIPILLTMILAFASADSMAQMKKHHRPDKPGMPDKPGPKKCMMMKKHHRCPMGNPEMMKKVLNLSDKQIEQIEAIRVKYKKQVLTYKEKTAPLKVRLQRLLLEDTVDLNAVKTLLKEISDQKVEIRMLKIQERIEIEKVLTPQQRTKMKSFHKGRKHCPAGPPR